MSFKLCKTDNAFYEKLIFYISTDLYFEQNRFFERSWIGSLLTCTVRMLVWTSDEISDSSGLTFLISESHVHSDNTIWKIS